MPARARICVRSSRFTSAWAVEAERCFHVSMFPFVRINSVERANSVAPRPAAHQDHNRAEYSGAISPRPWAGDVHCFAASRARIIETLSHGSGHPQPFFQNEVRWREADRETNRPGRERGRPGANDRVKGLVLRWKHNQLNAAFRRLCAATFLKGVSHTDVLPGRLVCDAGCQLAGIRGGLGSNGPGRAAAPPG